MKNTLLIALLVFFLAGCGSDNPQPAPGKADSQKAPVAAKTPAARTGGAGPGVVIHPERLQSTSTALATASGCSGAMRYLWSVNGAPAADATGDRLTPEHFRRDDEVSVQVLCNGASATATAKVTNSPPQVTLVKFQNPVVVAGQEIVAVPEAFDPDGDTADFEYQWLVDGTEIPVYDRTLPGNFVKSGSRITLNVIATDGIDKNAPYWGEPFTVQGATPRFTTQPPQSFQAQEYRYQARAVDPDGDRLTYQLAEAPPGMVIDPATGLVTWAFAPATTGKFRIKIVVKDSSGSFASQEYSLSLKPGE